ncbi:MAG: hypothetical protein IID31_13490, partial [Planctomycetes bacterium]|nr:hypothetical protein [Planctomycetota bacterium]
MQNLSSILVVDQRLKCVAACAVGLVLALCATGAWAQGDPTPPDSGSEARDSRLADVDAPIPGPPSDNSGFADVKTPEDYGLWVIAPAVVAIVLAMILRQAVPALFIGVLVGGYMLIPCMDPSARPSGHPALSGLRLAIETYVINAIAEPGAGQKGHILIIVFTLTIGAMVGVISANGGTRALVEWVARFASTSRKGQLTGWLAGMVVFFDDYANSMIVGPTMRPMYDRLKISRAKLAYIVDSTAAPVASIALLGTWVGAELGFIQDGLDAVAATGAPEFMANMDKWDVFVQSIPYRFYPIFALWMVFVVALTGRDFGPMRGAESRALAENPPNTGPAGVGGTEPKASSGWLAALPILTLVGVTIGALYATGKDGLSEGDDASLRNILSSADSYISILYGALGSVSLALILSVLARACSLRVAMDGALDGMSRLFPAIVIL